MNTTCANFNNDSVVPTDPVTIDLEDRSTPYVVQDVMELAADAKKFPFTVTYNGKDTGYSIVELSGLEPAKDCNWYLFYRAPDEDKEAYQENARISLFTVEPNSTVILSYEPEPIIPPSPLPSPSPDPNNTGVGSSFSSLASVLCLLVVAALSQ